MSDARRAELERRIEFAPEYTEDEVAEALAAALRGELGRFAQLTVQRLADEFLAEKAHV